MSSRSDVYSPGNLRYFRLGSILQTEGKRAVRSYLETYYPGKTFSDFLGESAVKSKLYGLWKNKRKMKKEQFDKLYPKTGEVDIETLDISLLYLLIRSLHDTVSPSDLVWTKPLPGNLSGEADVSRITETRNRIWGHHDNVELTETEYLFESKNLEMAITRLAKTVGNQYIDPFDLSNRIKDKMSAKFDPTPTQMEAAVSTTDSLGKEEDAEEEKKDVATSTSSLQRERKLSFRLKQYLNPFIIRPNVHNTEQGANAFLPCKSQVNRRHSIKSNASNKLPARGSCMSFKCISKRHRRKYSRVRYFHTNNHQGRQCRCLLAGVARLKNGITVVTDTNHDCVQAFDNNYDLIGEVEVSSPRGVCPLSEDTVIVSLSKNSKLMIFKIDDVIHYVDDVNISCDGWMYDVKFVDGCAYVLCDKGQIHILNLQKSTEERLSLDTESKVEFFDISRSGDKIFLSDGRGVVCIDDSGAELWQYRGGRSGLKTTGVVSLKDRIIVAAWEEDKLVELTHDGKWIRDIGVDRMHSPMALCLCDRQIFATQYMSDLNEKICREIVTLRD